MARAGLMKTGILLSGGLDSIALCYWKRPEVAFTIDYGQLAAAGEIEAAKVVSRKLKIRHEIIRADCSSVGVGQLCSKVGRTRLAVKPPTPEWWPFRNQLLITLAATKAVTIGIRKLLIGSVATDRVHLDGTPQFVECMRDLLGLQEGRLSLLAPAINISSVELIRRSGIPLAILGWAHSCHTGNYACGVCRGCIKNQQVWEEIDHK